MPDIRRRLKETRCGQMAWNKVLSWSHSLRGTYDEKAAYAQPDLVQGDNRGTHGHITNLYYHDKDSPWQPGGGWYKRLIAGDMTADPKPYWPVYALEAFRCLIENDGAGAQDLAKAVVTSMKIEQAQRAADPKLQGKVPDLAVDSIPAGNALAYTYDFIYNWLTPEQRAAIHDELAQSTWHHDNYGTFNDASASRSNWATFSYWMVQELAIEGEPGFNDLKFRGLYRGWRNFLTYGYFASGAVFEGEAKAQLGMDGVIAFAMREQRYGLQNLAGHPHLRAYATNFLPHAIVPAGRDFVSFDLLGGAGWPEGGHIRPNGIDLLGLKYLFPDDKKIDWAYRNYVGADYTDMPRSPDGYANPGAVLRYLRHRLRPRQ